MRRFMLLLAFVVAASALALGQAGNVERSIKAMTEQLNQAALKGDVATYDKLLADDYISISIVGGTTTKAEILVKRLFQQHRIVLSRLPRSN